MPKAHHSASTHTALDRWIGGGLNVGSLGVRFPAASHPVSHWHKVVSPTATQPIVQPSHSPPHNARTMAVSAAVDSAGGQQVHISVMSAPEAIAASHKAATATNTLPDLQQAIATFKGLSICQQAAHSLFAKGNPQASLMIVVDCPDSSDERSGHLLSGSEGRLLDNMLAAIGRRADSTDIEAAYYAAAMVPWRPAGGRAPTLTEQRVGWIFLARHIQLVQPKVIWVLGEGAARPMLGRRENISRLRGSWGGLEPADLVAAAEGFPTASSTAQDGLDKLGMMGKILLRAGYHPRQLLEMPTQKALAWEDLQALEAVF